MYGWLVDLGTIAMKGYCAFLKAPAWLEPPYKIVPRHINDTRWSEAYLSAGVQSVYSTAPAD